MAKILDDTTYRQIVNTIEQCRDRIGQHAYTGRPIDSGLQTQIAQALESAMRQLLSLPETQETK